MLHLERRRARGSAQHRSALNAELLHAIAARLRTWLRISAPPEFSPETNQRTNRRRFTGTRAAGNDQSQRLRTTSRQRPKESSFSLLSLLLGNVKSELAPHIQICSTLYTAVS